VLDIGSLSSVDERRGGEIAHGGQIAYVVNDRVPAAAIDPNSTHLRRHAPLSWLRRSWHIGWRRLERSGRIERQKHS